MKLWAILSVVFAFAAALLWGWSALINVPLLKSGYGTLVSVMKDGSTVIGEAPFYAALANISRLNAGAAGCAFLSALTQAIRYFQVNSRAAESCEVGKGAPHGKRPKCQSRNLTILKQSTHWYA